LSRLRLTECSIGLVNEKDFSADYAVMLRAALDKAVGVAVCTSRILFLGLSRTCGHCTSCAPVFQSSHVQGFASTMIVAADMQNWDVVANTILRNATVAVSNGATSDFDSLNARLRNPIHAHSSLY
jgi:hypothetical protein